MGYQESRKRSSNPNTKSIPPHSHTTTTNSNKRRKIKKSFPQSNIYSPMNNIKAKKYSQKNHPTPTSVFRPPPATVITNHNHNQQLCKSPSPITDNTPPALQVEMQNKLLRAENIKLLNELKLASGKGIGKELQQENENPTIIQDISETKTTINENLLNEALQAQIKTVSKNQVFKKVKFISSKAELMNCNPKTSVGAYFLKCFTKIYPMDTVKDKVNFWAKIQDTVHQAICQKRGAVYNRFKKRWFGKFPILIMEILINFIFLTYQRAL